MSDGNNFSWWRSPASLKTSIVFSHRACDESFTRRENRASVGAVRRAHRFDERPVGVPLAIFVTVMRTQKHAGRWSHA